MSLVKWDTVASSKDSGGLGIQKLQELNLAYMVKLGWHLQREKDSLWAQILSNKYQEGKPASFSNAWRGVTVANPVLETGVVKWVRNGKSTRFWIDKWIAPYPLFHYLKSPLSLHELYVNVSDYWEEDCG